jgi:hypothetical protein
MAVNDRWLGGQPLPNLPDGSELAGSQQWWGQGQPASGLDSNSVLVLEPIGTALVVTGQPCTVNEILCYPSVGSIACVGNTVGFVHFPLLFISQLAVEASNYDVATAVQLQVSQLAAEASSYHPTPAIWASQVLVEAVDKEAPIVITPAPALLYLTGGQLPKEFNVIDATLGLLGSLSPVLFVTLPLWPQVGSLTLARQAVGSLQVYQWALPIADIAVGAFVPSVGGVLYSCVAKYEEPDDSTYIEATEASEATLQLSGLNVLDETDTAEIVVRMKREAV